ncbi:hypothetical protein CSB45_05620 [candidate division KSB3 bacterium]|uniref:Uncharacterized protein n=1 Tax=candidate division KSB3 bacterium TaxID=2044937 RepID=A0A2G6E7I5_9BACT|nr:MAG: hypothetical protein CSB45_05620 [candidate division KSB3 bacterium]PIE30134.1 MAG: hypothetical protein CSA57_04330 [candidate division KSB3 bacterium]
MKTFHAESEQNIAELEERCETLERTVDELRRLVGRRRTMLKDAEKKVQEFQDSICAVLIEDDFSREQVLMSDDSVDGSTDNS